MNYRKRVVRRLVGGAVLLGVLIAGSSCSSNAPQEPPAVSSPHTAHTGKSATPAAPLRGGERFITLSMPQPYTPVAPNGGTDEYRCFLVDPGLTKEAFLTGSRFLPQNADIVHHAIFFRVDPAQVAEARRSTRRARARAGPVSATPASRTTPPGSRTGRRAPMRPCWRRTSAIPMHPGSRLVMQVHYNLLGTAGQAAPTGRASGCGSPTAPASSRWTRRCCRRRWSWPARPDESGPLCDRAAAVRDVARRFGERSEAAADQLNEMCNQGQPDGRRPCSTATIGSRAPARFTRSAGTCTCSAGRSPWSSTRAARSAGPLLDVPAYNFDEQAVVPLPEPVEVKRGRHPAGHLYARRDAPAAAAATAETPTAVRGLGRGHQRRDVPRPGGLVTESVAQVGPDTLRSGPTKPGLLEELEAPAGVGVRRRARWRGCR